MKKSEKGKYDHFIEGGIILGIGIVMMLILFGAFGGVGLIITNFFIGVFGYTIYAFVIMFNLVGVLIMLKVKAPKISLIRIIGIAVFAIMIIGLTHIISSADLSKAGYGKYISGCYVNHDTAGGVIAAIFTYPIMAINYYFAIVLVALLAIVSSGVVVFHGTIEEVIAGRSKKTKHAEPQDIDSLYDTEYMQTGNGLNIGEMREDTPKATGRKRDKVAPEPDSYLSLDELSEVRAREQYARDNNIISKELPQEPDTSFRSKAMGIFKKEVPVQESAPQEPAMEGSFGDAVDVLYGKSVRDQAILTMRTSTYDEADLKSYSNDYRLEKLRRRLSGEDNNVLADNAEESLEQFDVVIEDVTNSYKVTGMSEDINDINNSIDSGVINAERDNSFNNESLNNSRDNSLGGIANNSRDNSLGGSSNVGFASSKANGEPDFFKVEKIEITKDIPTSTPEVNSALAARLAKHKAKQNNNTPQATPNPPATVYEESGDFTDILRKQREAREAESRNQLLQRHNVEQAPNTDLRERIARSDKGGSHQVGTGVKFGGIMEGSTPPLQRLDSLKPIDIPKIEEEKKAAVKRRPKLAKYKFPPLSLLEDYKSNEDGNEDFALKQTVLEEMFSNFGIDAKVMNIIKGPTFSRMELMMPRGISVNKIANLSNDIAMCLEVDSVRCQIPIPGKNLFGVEVPNKVRGMVGLKQVIKSNEFANPKHSVTFALGQDCDGNNYVADLAKMPHLLIAGATGAGKSVCINSLICSMVYKYTPQQLRLLLVDPKHVELNMYNGIPHLLIPTTVCDKDKALNLLDWAIEEMELRYTTFAQSRVQNIGDYNKIPDLKQEDILPHIAIIIDEVGDLMTYVKKELEERIVRLTQKARAAGICLILATQRPSVDVITGIIKANLPSRIAFAVPSYADSKTIIDAAGAEKLLRNGDMLFSESSSPVPVRVQGTFISGQEVNAICDYIRDNNEAYFDPEVENMIMNEKPNGANASGTSFSNTGNTSSDEDDMFVKALNYFVHTKKVSITNIQRRFGVGFPRAARIVDLMEDKGYIVAKDNKKEIAISVEDFTKLYGDRIIE